MDTFGRCLTAVFEVLGDKNPGNAQTWGKVFGGKIFAYVYPEKRGRAKIIFILKKTVLKHPGFLSRGDCRGGTFYSRDPFFPARNWVSRSLIPESRAAG